ncbi:MAG: heavy metal-binding domain-containing protein [Abitibacteriaceae bacterium]|nr:heavy metal-binding domain-containing protein [Abditibacteriaceae bacterium]MBV9868239.1 heavy metal-binding domain-containing protein [Abditibacteriaceae bacterium]
MRLRDLFGGSDPAQEQAREAAQQRQEASQRSIEAGGLPLNATARLQEQASRQGTPQHFFTSDLSVNELSLTRQAGYHPLGQVMGSSVYHVGWQWRTQSWRNGVWQTGASYELDVMTQAFYHARHLALGRLQQEAQLLGATGVVGVRLERKEYEWGVGLLEFAAIGTAIRETTAPRPTKATQPFVGNLSGEEFWTLRQAGYRPVGFAIGNCSYYAIPSWNTQWATQGGIFNSSSWQNMELTEYTQGLYNARELAMERMEAEARAVGADGIIGADVHVEAEPVEIDTGNNQHRTDMLYHFTAIGTSIVSAPHPPRQLSITPVISMKPWAEGKNASEDVQFNV